MRLFIAINFNDYIKNELCSVMENLKKYTLRGRFTSRENLHLTIVFIGETNKVEAVKKQWIILTQLLLNCIFTV